MKKYYSLIISIFCFITGFIMVIKTTNDFINILGYLQFGIAGFNLRNFINELKGTDE